ncbi:hypothetical protein [Streptomyces sp. NBC_00568]|uniref:hypothetical protein n=1 Tax=Streptomyces sp. NBC_00568 TaxID=2975779 RepID=UPI00224DAB5F|nr:hypothetical protein [Streptomyces sp. NBC_00568]MCX4993749.1 hypothetical protein [Streptomyces sp. NBC_00568]
MTRDELRHPALTGEPWPVIGVRVRREDHSPRPASWRPASHAVLEDVLRLCARASRPAGTGVVAAPDHLPDLHGWKWTPRW